MIILRLSLYIISVIIATSTMFSSAYASDITRNKVKAFINIANSLEKKGRALESMRQNNDPTCMRGMNTRKQEADALLKNIDAANLPREYSVRLGVAAIHLSLCVTCAENPAREACDMAHEDIIQVEKLLKKPMSQN